MPTVVRTDSIPYVIVALIAAVLGAALVHNPWFVLIVVGAGCLAAFSVPLARALSLWQMLTLVVLIGYIVLNYGFANLAFHPRIPLDLGHVLLLGALLLAAAQGSSHILPLLREPVAIWWLGLVALSVVHLSVDFRQFGVYAIRDASFVFEGIFMLLGWLWARSARQRSSLLYALTLVFILNAAYAFTYPIRQTVLELSPVSGLFQRVAVFGSYGHTPVFLVLGALYYLLVAGHVVQWPRILLVGFAVLQIAWSLIFQSRTMYFGLTLVFGLLFFLVGIRRGSKVALLLLGSVIAFFLIVGLLNVTSGRIGELRPEFFLQHLKGVTLDPDSPAVGSVEWRLTLISNMWKRWTSSPSSLLFGEGFGEPLTDMGNSQGVITRQPHNTHLTVLVRLGLLGLLMWLGMLWVILSRLIGRVRQLPYGTIEHDIAVWLLLYFLLANLFTATQPWLEFSYGAIPFYIIVGFAMGQTAGDRQITAPRV